MDIILLNISMTGLIVLVLSAALAAIANECDIPFVESVIAVVALVSAVVMVIALAAALLIFLWS